MVDNHQNTAPVPPSEDAPAVRVSTRRALEAEGPPRFAMWILRLVFLVVLVAGAWLPLVGTGTSGATGRNISMPVFIGVAGATLLFGFVVVFIDAAIPHKRLSQVFGIYLGLMAGLLGALAIGALLDFVAESWDLTVGTWTAYRGMVKFVIGITLCYLAVTLVLTTKDDFRLVIPYVEFAKQVRGVRPLLLDTSAIIDGRIEGLSRTGFIDAPIVLPQFVIDELQTLSDSSDKLKRERGRRGLGIVTKLQENPYIDVSIDATDMPGRSVDHKLLAVAADQRFRVVSTDYNLQKVAKIQGVPFMNINDLANELKGQVAPGSKLTVIINKAGENPHQGVGYLPDGTMVVVEGAAELVGRAVQVIVSNSLQTAAGRMIFAQPDTTPPDPDTEREKLAKEEAVTLEAAAPPASSSPTAIPSMSKAATNQPRATNRPARPKTPTSRRNPRR